LLYERLGLLYQMPLCRASDGMLIIDRRLHSTCTCLLQIPFRGGARLG